MNAQDSYEFVLYKILQVMLLYLEKCYHPLSIINPILIKMDDDLIINPILFRKIIENLALFPNPIWTAGELVERKTSYLNGQTYFISGPAVHMIWEFARCFPLQPPDDVELMGNIRDKLKIVAIPLNNYYTNGRNIGPVLKAARINVGVNEQRNKTIIHPCCQEEDYRTIWKFFVRYNFFA